MTYCDTGRAPVGICVSDELLAQQAASNILQGALDRLARLRPTDVKLPTSSGQQLE
jgi:hypothetical protein